MTILTGPHDELFRTPEECEHPMWRREGTKCQACGTENITTPPKPTEARDYLLAIYAEDDAYYESTAIDDVALLAEARRYFGALDPDALWPETNAALLALDRADTTPCPTCGAAYGQPCVMYARHERIIVPRTTHHQSRITY